MKAEKDRLMPLADDGDKRLPFKHKNDRRHNFIVDAPVALCNETSVKAIKKVQIEKCKSLSDQDKNINCET